MTSIPKLLPRLLLTLACLAAALFFYFLGVESGATAFLVLGIGFETSFWLRAFRRRVPRHYP